MTHTAASITICFPTLNAMQKPKLTFIPFALPDIGDEEIGAVTEALRSGWVTTGPKTKQFEQSFTAYLGGDVESQIGRASCRERVCYPV